MSTDDPFTEDVSEPCPEGRGITIDDFIAYLPSHVYICGGEGNRLPKTAPSWFG